MVLAYRRLVVKDKRNAQVKTPAAPANVLEGSFADVSFLAGMLVDQFCHHLPLYRQHQRLAMSGISVSRSTLTQLVQRACQLLEPIYEAQRRNLLRSKVLTIDETPSKTARAEPGKMNPSWFWPIYGQGYVSGREAALEVYLHNPDVAIDTNHLERALRPIPLGRKNWLFNWTELGAHHVAVVQSLLVTCRQHEINPYGYLVDVLQRVGQHPAKQVHELAPRLWKEKFVSNPLLSDVQRVGR